MGLFSFLHFFRQTTVVVILTPTNCGFSLVTHRAKKPPELTQLASLALVGRSLSQLIDSVQTVLNQHQATVRQAKVCVLLADEWCYTLSSPYTLEDSTANLHALLPSAIPVSPETLTSDIAVLGHVKGERSTQFIALSQTLTPSLHTFLTALHLDPVIFEPLSLSYARELLVIPERPERCLFLEISKLRTHAVLIEKERIVTSFVISATLTTAHINSVIDIAKNTHNITIEKIYVSTQSKTVPQSFLGIPVERRSFQPVIFASKLAHDSTVSMLPPMRLNLLDSR